MLYPEGYLIGSWTDDGRLPLAVFDRLPIFAFTALWLAIATLVGWPWCARRDKSATPAATRAAQLVEVSLACLCGLSLLSTLTLVVGLAGGLSSRWPLLLSVLATIAIGQLWRTKWVQVSFSDKHSQVGSLGEKRDLTPLSLFQRMICNAVIAATAWLGAVTMLGAWVPPREFDVVEYHLQAPKEFYQAGRIDFVPHNIYANMPLGGEMHALAAMTMVQSEDTWLGGLIGKSITAAISLVGAILLGGWVAQRMGSFSGWTAAGIWLGTPGITHVATLGLIDGVLATYVLATAIVTVNWYRTVGVSPLPAQLGEVESSRSGEIREGARSRFGPASINKPPPARASAERLAPTSSKQSSREVASCGFGAVGLIAGGAAALKYPGLIYATVPCLLFIALMVVRLIRQQQSSHAIRLSIMTLLGLSVTCLPWYAKNWWLAGNPVYPLAASLFGGQTLTPEKIAQWQAAHRVPVAMPADAGLPQQVIGSARQLSNDFARVTLTSSFVQPAMIIGLVCAVVWLWQRRQRQSTASVKADRSIEGSLWIHLGWSVWILVVWWLATHRIDRFWLPITGLWSVLAAWGLWQVRQRSLSLAQTMLLSGLCYSVLICSSPVVTDNRYFVSLAALRDDVGDENHLPRVPLVQTWINQNLASPDTRLLLVGEARVFEYRVDVVYSTCFDTNPGEAWLAGADPAGQRAALTAAGITHVLINWSEIERYRSPGNYGFSQWPQPADVEQLLRDQILQPIPWGGNDRVQLFKVLR